MRVAALGGALLVWCAAAAAGAPAISVVIDDLGDRWTEGRDAVDLPGAVALAFLPESHFTRRLAERAYASGKEILLHLPLEPIDGKPHPLAISLAGDVPAREALLTRALAAVPHVTGVNNHQGSLMTERRDQMDWLMQRLRAFGGVYFLDSYTTSLSVAYAAARAQGLQATRRQVFLDNVRTRDAIRRQWVQLLRLARSSGTALAIGHPARETLALLAEELPRLAAQGIRLVPPSELIRLQQQRSPIQSRELRLRLTLRLQSVPEPLVPLATGAGS